MLIPLSFILIFMNTIKDSTQIQNVKLILPTVVQAGSSVTLLCLYDLEGASLYSVQWYRGQFEFFRFVPRETPSTKVFHIPGLNVDTSASNDHQVTLTNISVHLSGEFSCEITTDAPPFSTSCVSENLTIVDFHLNLEVPQRQYHFGDMIHANCTLMPNIPGTKLILYWNSKPISEKFITHVRSVNGLLESLLMHLNTSIYDAGQTSAVLVQLRCSATLNDMQLLASKTISLRLKPKLPTFSVASKTRNSLIFILIFTLTLGVME